MLIDRSRPIRTSLVGLIAVASAAWGASPEPPTPDRVHDAARSTARAQEPIVAGVGSSTITVDAFTDELRTRAGVLPGQYEDAAERRALLDEMVMKQALVEAAWSAGWAARLSCSWARCAALWCPAFLKCRGILTSWLIEAERSRHITSQK